MFTYEDIIKYSSVNDKLKLPLHGILELFQNCVNLQGRQIRRDYLKDANKVWVLISWKIKLVKPICLYDKVKVGTWSRGYDRIYGYRDYVIYDEKGEVCACADTMWALIDIKSRMPLKVTSEDMEGYETGDGIEDLKCSRKLRLSPDYEEMETVKVLKTYIDSNGHMNNTAYFRLAEEYLPDDFEYNTVDAVYVKEAVRGSKMIPRIHREDAGIGISFESEDGDTYMLLRYSCFK